MRSLTVHGAGTTNLTFEIEWRDPPALAGAFESAADRAAALALGLTWLQRQAAEGQPESRVELGYFHLYGVGLPRDLAEAERLFRSSDDAQLPAYLAMLAWEYAVEPGQWRRAAELALELLEAGNEPSLSRAVWSLATRALENREKAALAKSGGASRTRTRSAVRRRRLPPYPRAK